MAATGFVPWCPETVVRMSALFGILVDWSIVALAALPLTLTTGCGGMVSLAQGALFGAGAYGAALAAIRLGWGFGGSLLLGGAASAVLAGLSGLVLCRLRGDAFVLASVALVVGCAAVASNWTAVTGGPYGLAGIPRRGLDLPSRAAEMSVFGGLVVAGYFAVFRLARGRLGLRLRVVRESMAFAASLGERTNLVRWMGLTVAAGLTGVAGALRAHQLGFVGPSYLATSDSLMLLAVVFTGGADRPLGALLGAAFYVALPQLLRLTGWSDANAANANQIVFGLLIIAVLMVRPRGLVGSVDVAAIMATED